MSDIKIEPGTWVKVFDKDEPGVFRLVGFKARIKRAVTAPVGITGVTEFAKDDDTSTKMHWLPKDSNIFNLYVYNAGRRYGLIEVDV